MEQNSKKLSMRFNNDKPKYSLLHLPSLEPCVKVLEFGAKKYAPNNWQIGLKRSEVLDSLMRHIKDLQNGKELDDESGLPIIGHIQCNALFLGHPNTFNDKENIFYSENEKKDSYIISENIVNKLKELTFKVTINFTKQNNLGSTYDDNVTFYLTQEESLNNKNENIINKFKTLYEVENYEDNSFINVKSNPPIIYKITNIIEEEN